MGERVKRKMEEICSFEFTCRQERWGQNKTVNTN
jgi:hypothetical protein